MALSARGCKARVEFLANQPDGSIIVEITTKKKVKYRRGDAYVPDFKARVFLCNNGERVYTGDYIQIDDFYIRNVVDGKLKYPSFTITAWHVIKRANFTKTKAEAEIIKAKNRQRKQIEEELEAEEQDLDEYIENIDENYPF